MTVVAHISDTHFGTEQVPVVAALRAWIGAQRPHVLILSGDVTQRARRAQFAAARACLDALSVRNTLVIPGNHDLPLFNLAARAWAPYGGYAAVFGPDLEPELELSELLVLCVNTTRPTRHKHGVVSPAQVARVARRLERASAAQLRIVVTHQPVLVTRASERNNLLRGHEAAARAWAAAGADLLLGGHIHLPYVAPLSGAHGGLPRDAWVVQAGTAVSSRVRRSAPNSVNLIRHDAARHTCTVERWDYVRARAAFEPVEETRIALARR